MATSDKQLRAWLVIKKYMLVKNLTGESDERVLAKLMRDYEIEDTDIVIALDEYGGKETGLLDYVSQRLNEFGMEHDYDAIVHNQS